MIGERWINSSNGLVLNCINRPHRGEKVLRDSGFASASELERAEAEQEKAAKSKAYFESLQVSKVCPICNKEFTTTNKIQQTCSRACGIQLRKQHGWKGHMAVRREQRAARRATRIVKSVQ